MYKFTSSKSAGAWDSNKVTAVSLGDLCSGTLSVRNVTGSILDYCIHMRTIVQANFFVFTANNTTTDWPFTKFNSGYIMCANAGSRQNPNEYTLFGWSVSGTMEIVNIKG